MESPHCCGACMRGRPGSLRSVRQWPRPWRIVAPASPQYRYRTGSTRPSSRRPKLDGDRSCPLLCAIDCTLVTNFNRARALPSYIAVMPDTDKLHPPGPESPGQNGPERVPDRRARGEGSPRYHRRNDSPVALKPSFSSTRPEAGLSTKCDASSCGSLSVRAIWINARPASVAKPRFQWRRVIQ